MKKKLNLPPGPRLPTLVRLWPQYTSNQKGFYLGLHARYGSIFRLPINPLMGAMAYVVSDPALVKHYLIDNAANYTKNFFAGRRDPAGVGGEAVSTSEGAFWRRHRRIVQPAFQRDWLGSLVPRMVGAVQRHLDAYWEPRMRQGEPVDVFREMSRLNLAMLGQLAFSQDPSPQLSDAIYVYLTEVIRKRTVWALLSDLLPGHLQYLLMKWSNPAFFPSTDYINQFLRELLAHRRKEPQGYEDMMARVMAGRDEKGQELNDLELRDEVVDIFYGGHVSITAGLTWAWYSLVSLPEVSARLAEEVGQVLNGRLPTTADLPRLQFTSRVFEETLRMYPPAPGALRVAMQDDQVAGYDVPAGTIMGASCFILHNHPDYWERPQVFDPDRFLPERSEQRPKYAYMPFGAGQRLCMGERLAMTMSALVLSMVTQRYRLALAPGARVREVASGIYYPKNVLMLLQPASRPALAPPAGA